MSRYINKITCILLVTYVHLFEPKLQSFLGSKFTGKTGNDRQTVTCLIDLRTLQPKE